MKCLPRILLVLFLSYIGFVSAMEPARVPLRPIDKVFLNACKNNKPINDILKMEPAPNINAADPETGYTGLHYVCMNGDVKKAQLLLDNGANINQQSKDGTPLYEILGTVVLGGKNLDASQRFEMVRFLIEHGADIWTKGPNDQSILQAAVIKGDIHSLKLLIDAMKRDQKKDWNMTALNVGYDALYEAVAVNREDIFFLLLDAGVPVTTAVRHGDGMSIMHNAAPRGNRRIIQELIKRGVDIDTLDDDGQTALHYAGEYGPVQIVQTLLDLGADPRIRDKMGRTPLDLSRDNPHKKVRELLLRATKSVPKISPQTVGVAIPGATKTDTSNKTKPESKKSKRQARKELLASKREKGPVIKIEVPEEIKASGQEMVSNIDKPEKAIPTSPREMEPTSQEIAGELEKSPESKFSVKSIGRYVRDEARDTVKNLTEKVEELTERVTNPTKENITPASLAKTYAGMVGNQSSEQPAVQSVTILDDNMTITVPIPPSMQNRFAVMTQQNNPLAKITSYSPHVEEKRQRATDIYHNFSSQIEERLGFFANSEIIKNATKKHGPIIKYTIPARVTIFSEQPIHGTFEFTVRDGQMIHRFFKPDPKKKKKEKISLRLPASESDKDKGLSQ